MPLGEGLSIDSRSAEITDLLKAWGSGDQAALDQLSKCVYHELRLMARRHMKNERQGNTLQTTALVHEVYLRLVDVTKVEWQNPHTYIYIDVTDKKSGKVTNWIFELGSPSGLSKRGWTPASRQERALSTVTPPTAR